MNQGTRSCCFVRAPRELKRWAAKMKKSSEIEIAIKNLSMAFMGAIVGGAIKSALPVIYPLVLLGVLVVLLVLVFNFVKAREAELGQPNKGIKRN